MHPNDPNYFIRIVPDRLGHQVNLLMDTLTTSLKDLGISVSTGPVVDFRAKDMLRDKADGEIIPLIYSHNLNSGYVKWPIIKTKKPSYLASTIGIERLVVPARYYVLVKRFSSKEEKRRIYAAVYDPTRISATRVGIENHINFFYKNYGEFSKDWAKGLAVFLNSSLVDQYFRLFSGHTQVNATDLRNMKYPTELQLINLGREIGDEFPNQDEIDRIISKHFIQNGMDGVSEMNDPIQAKKKIKEALNIRERPMPMIPVILPDGDKLMLSSGGQNELIKKIIEEFCPRYTPGGKLIYIGDAGQKVTEQEMMYFDELGIKINKHGKMPDVIIELFEKKWLVLIEAVTSHGPIDLKRHNELKELFDGGAYGLVFVTAFESLRAMHRYLSVIAWETEV